MSKKICLKPVLIISLLLICFVLTVAVSQGDLFAEEKGTGWFKDDSAKSSSFNGYEGYTRVISTLLLVVALAIGTVFMLRKKYGVKTKIGRGKKFIQINHILHKKVEHNWYENNFYQKEQKLMLFNIIFKD